MSTATLAAREDPRTVQQYHPRTRASVVRVNAAILFIGSRNPGLLPFPALSSALPSCLTCQQNDPSCLSSRFTPAPKVIKNPCNTGQRQYPCRTKLKRAANTRALSSSRSALALVFQRVGSSGPQLARLSQGMNIYLCQIEPILHKCVPRGGVFVFVFVFMPPALRERLWRGDREKHCDIRSTGLHIRPNIENIRNHWV